MADAPVLPVAAAERHDPFTPSNVGPNTPGKRAPQAAIWTEKQFMRLLPDGRRSAPLIAKGFTHVCVLRRDSDGKPCNAPLKLTKNKLGGTWLSTKALAHVRNDLEHASHPLAVQEWAGSRARASVCTLSQREH